MEQLHILRDLAVIFAGSLLVILVFHRFKLPALPGFIVAGILLGPNALGLVSDPKDVESLAEVGVIMLLFTIGIEFSLSRLREMGRQILVGGFSQMGVTVLATGTIVRRALAAILKTRSRELFLIAVILIGTLTALGTAAAGASLALGAFLAGLIISESDYGHQALAELMPFRDIFISLFFVAVGMLVQLDTIKTHIGVTVLAVLVVI